MAEQKVNQIVGTVKTVEGTVYLRDENGTLIPATEGMPVYANQSIETGADGSILVELVSGQTFTVGRDTLVKLDSDVTGQDDPEENTSTQEDVNEAVRAVLAGNFKDLEDTKAGQGGTDISSSNQGGEVVERQAEEGEVTSGFDTSTDSSDDELEFEREFSAFSASTEITVTNVSSAAVEEGNQLVHTVTLNTLTDSKITLPFSLTGNTATAGEDFNATPVFSNGVT